MSRRYKKTNWTEEWWGVVVVVVTLLLMFACYSISATERVQFYYPNDDGDSASYTISEMVSGDTLFEGNMTEAVAGEGARWWVDVALLPGNYLVEGYVKEGTVVGGFVAYYLLVDPSILVASDNIGINWADVSNPTSTVDLSNTTIANVSLGTDAITAATIAAGAITSSEAPNLDVAVSSRGSLANQVLIIDTVNGIIDTLQNQDDWVAQQAEIDTLFMLLGYQIGSQSFTRYSAAADTVVLTTATGDTIARLIYDHPTGSPGDAPDSVTTITGP